MPGEEDADIQIGGTQDALAPNARCPLSGKALLDLAEPVKCVRCGASDARNLEAARRRAVRANARRCDRDNQGYVYEKAAIVAYLNTKNGGNPLALVVSPSSGARPPRTRLVLQLHVHPPCWLMARAQARRTSSRWRSWRLPRTSFARRSASRQPPHKRHAGLPQHAGSPAGV